MSSRRHRESGGAVGDQVQNPQGDHLRKRTGVPRSTDARRTSVLALTARNQLARARQQRVVHPEQRLAEADAAGIVVVDENARLVGQFGGLAASREIGIVALFAAADRAPDLL